MESVIDEEATRWRRVRQDSSREDFAVLYDLHADRVFSHLRRRGLSEATAEDVTADVFMATWRQRATIQVAQDDGLLPWLLAVANNQLRKHWRRADVQARAHARMPAPLSLVDDAEDVIDALTDERDIQVIRQVLSNLGDRDQEVIALCVIEGLTPGAVAAALGEPPATVRSRLSRALSRARRLYATYIHDQAHEAETDR